MSLAQPRLAPMTRSRLPSSFSRGLCFIDATRIMDHLAGGFLQYAHGWRDAPKAWTGKNGVFPNGL